MTTRRDPGPAHATGRVPGRALRRIVATPGAGLHTGHRVLEARAARRGRDQGAATAVATRGHTADPTVGRAADLGPEVDQGVGREVGRAVARLGPGAVRPRDTVAASARTARTVGPAAAAARGRLGVARKTSKLGRSRRKRQKATQWKLEESTRFKARYQLNPKAKEKRWAESVILKVLE